MKTFNFSSMIRFGMVGEETVMDWLKKEWGAGVRDVRDDPKYQDMGVDFLVQGTTYVEVKTDSHASENIFIELSVGDKGGWIKCSRAHLLCYYFASEGKMYLIPMAGLRVWVDRNLEKIVKKEPWRKKRITSSGRGGGTWETVGVIVPTNSIMRQISGVREVKL